MGRPRIKARHYCPLCGSGPRGLPQTRGHMIFKHDMAPSEAAKTMEEAGLCEPGHFKLQQQTNNSKRSSSPEELVSLSSALAQSSSQDQEKPQRRLL